MSSPHHTASEDEPFITHSSGLTITAAVLLRLVMRLVINAYNVQWFVSHLLNPSVRLLRYCSHSRDYSNTETYNICCPDAAPSVVTA